MMNQNDSRDCHFDQIIAQFWYFSDYSLAPAAAMMVLAAAPRGARP